MSLFKDVGEAFADWMRPGRKADMTKVPLDKLVEAGKRGIEVDLQPGSGPGERVAQINQTVVRDMPTKPK